MKQSKKKSTLRNTLFIIAGSIFLLLVICLILGTFIYFNISTSSGSIFIEEFVVTDEIDAQGKPLPIQGKLKSTTPRIYCYVRVESPKPIHMSVKWYFENAFIREDSAMVNEWRAFYIERTEEQEFDAGTYKVELILINDVIRTIKFEIEDY